MARVPICLRLLAEALFLSFFLSFSAQAELLFSLFFRFPGSISAARSFCCHLFIKILPLA